MLEVRNLKKIYKTKNGVNVNALDGVSLQFPETGMVFLLGKSGSGKSTLLNVCGGLDSPSDGEVIVKGRSSKDFSQSDFDSYRNTFIGFIFQEYNILNEFSVEDNIALALELQGKSKNKAAINKLLAEVDLEGFGKRKPNTLSGGQKQRIAIARALIKSPEIIMADEPTGALDSNTGKQVFETLKKLSKDKLVIIVSHDRDFAEQYADRIIELKDGKVLSDSTKTQVAKTSVTENVQSLGDVLCIKNGSSLSDADFDNIKAFLKNSDKDVVIATNEKDINKFKKVSHITDDGTKEVFADTDSSKIATKQYTKAESRFISSKLPLRHSMKIGLSGLKSKPIRLIFTIFLCTVTFVMFGLLSTLTFYDTEATFRQSMTDSSNTTMKIEKRYATETTWYINDKKNHSYKSHDITRFTAEDLENYKTDFGDNVFGAINMQRQINVRSSPSNYWNPTIYSIGYLPESHLLRQTMNGKYPEKENDILISSYTAETLYQCKMLDNNGNLVELKSADELIGKEISLSGAIYTVTGIFDSGMLDPKFDILKEQNNEFALLMDFNTTLEDGLHLVAFTSQEGLDRASREIGWYPNNTNNYYAQILLTTNTENYEYHMTYVPMSKIPSAYTVLMLNNATLDNNSVLIPLDTFCSFISNKLYEKDNVHEDTKLNAILTLASDLQNRGIWEYDESKDEHVLKKFTDEQMKTKMTELINSAQKSGLIEPVSAQFTSNYDGSTVGEKKSLNIAGIYITSDENQYSSDVYVSDTYYDALWSEHKQFLTEYSIVSTKYVFSNNEKYDHVYLPYDKSAHQTDMYWDMYNNETVNEDDSLVSLSGNFVSNLKMIDNMVKNMSQVFLYVGLVMALFAALLFSNFISVSISQKKKDIGILRAVGARSFDVFKIFFSESFFISLICIAFATAGSIVVCNLLNVELSQGIGASLLVFGPVSFIVLVAIALVTAVIATFLPVYNAARKKPVDSIRAL